MGPSRPYPAVAVTLAVTFRRWKPLRDYLGGVCAVASLSGCILGAFVEGVSVLAGGEGCGLLEYLAEVGSCSQPD